MIFFFFKQKTAYELRISDWSSDVCSSDLLLARLPGLGPRSARRAVLHLMKKREALMLPLAEAMARAAETVTVCSTCGNLDTRDPCGICADPTRDPKLLCVVEEVADLWALERSGAFKGRYQEIGRASCRERVCHYV